MKVAGTLIGGLLALIGIIWILQGLNVLPGSFMTGQNSMGSVRRNRFCDRLRVALLRPSSWPQAWSQALR